MKLYIKQHGFTLIELLVVISIISLLSSVVLSSLNDARIKAKKAAFTETVLSIRTAMEIYRSTQGNYPSEGTIYSQGTYILDSGVPFDTFPLNLWVVQELIDKKALPGSYKLYSGGLGGMVFEYATTDSLGFYANSGGFTYLCNGIPVGKYYFYVRSENLYNDLNFPRLIEWNDVNSDGLIDEGEKTSSDNTYCFSDN